MRAKLSVERHEDLTAVTNERNEFGRIPVAEVRSPVRLGVRPSRSRAPSHRCPPAVRDRAPMRRPNEARRRRRGNSLYRQESRRATEGGLVRPRLVLARRLPLRRAPFGLTTGELLEPRIASEHSNLVLDVPTGVAIEFQRRWLPGRRYSAERRTSAQSVPKRPGVARLGDAEWGSAMAQRNHFAPLPDTPHHCPERTRGPEFESRRPDLGSMHVCGAFPSSPAHPSVPKRFTTRTSLHVPQYLSRSSCEARDLDFSPKP